MCYINNGTQYAYNAQSHGLTETGPTQKQLVYECKSYSYRTRVNVNDCKLLFTMTCTRLSGLVLASVWMQPEGRYMTGRVQDVELVTEPTRKHDDVVNVWWRYTSTVLLAELLLSDRICWTLSVARPTTGNSLPRHRMIPAQITTNFECFL